MDGPRQGVFRVLEMRASERSGEGLGARLGEDTASSVGGGRGDLADALLGLDCGLWMEGVDRFSVRLSCLANRLVNPIKTKKTIAMLY